MSILNTSNNSKQIKHFVDKMFSEYINYIATVSIDNIENCMKRNPGDRRSFNNQNYERILHYYNIFNYWGKIDPEKGVYELIENCSKALKEYHEDLLWLYTQTLRLPIQENSFWHHRKLVYLQHG